MVYQCEAVQEQQQVLSKTVLSGLNEMQSSSLGRKQNQSDFKNCLCCRKKHHFKARYPAKEAVCLRYQL